MVDEMSACVLSADENVVDVESLDELLLSWNQKP